MSDEDKEPKTALTRDEIMAFNGKPLSSLSTANLGNLSVWHMSLADNLTLSTKHEIDKVDNDEKIVRILFGLLVSYPVNEKNPDRRALSPQDLEKITIADLEAFAQTQLLETWLPKDGEAPNQGPFIPLLAQKIRTQRAEWRELSRGMSNLFSQQTKDMFTISSKLGDSLNSLHVENSKYWKAFNDNFAVEQPLPSGISKDISRELREMAANNPQVRTEKAIHELNQRATKAVDTIGTIAEMHAQTNKAIISGVNDLANKWQAITEKWQKDEKGAKWAIRIAVGSLVISTIISVWTLCDQIQSGISDEMHQQRIEQLLDRRAMPPLRSTSSTGTFFIDEYQLDEINEIFDSMTSQQVKFRERAP